MWIEFLWQVAKSTAKSWVRAANPANITKAGKKLIKIGKKRFTVKEMAKNTVKAGVKIGKQYTGLYDPFLGKKSGQFVKTKRAIRILSPKANLRFKIERQARLIERMVDTENHFLGKRTNVEKTYSETAREVLERERILKTFTREELETINNQLNTELQSLGIRDETHEQNIRQDQKEFYKQVKENAFESFMDNWKNGFFAYDPEDLGMSEDERQVMWENIEAEHDYGWFAEKKL